MGCVMKKDSEALVRVDRFGCEAGSVEKLVAHQKGILHRAVSVCIFDDKGRWLLQKRAPHKYHSPHLIANSCCSHPRPAENTLDAAERRLKEELGITCKLHFCSSFVYKATVGKDLIEHEHDHLYVGFHNDLPRPDPLEVDAVFYMEEKEIESKLLATPHLFAAWFPFVFREGVLHKKKIDRLKDL